MPSPCQVNRLRKKIPNNDLILPCLLVAAVTLPMPREEPWQRAWRSGIVENHRKGGKIKFSSSSSVVVPFLILGQKQSAIDLKSIALCGVRHHVGRLHGILAFIPCGTRTWGIHRFHPARCHTGGSGPPPAATHSTRMPCCHRWRRSVLRCLACPSADRTRS